MRTAYLRRSAVASARWLISASLVVSPTPTLGRARASVPSADYETGAALLATLRADAQQFGALPGGARRLRMRRVSKAWSRVAGVGISERRCLSVLTLLSQTPRSCRILRGLRRGSLAVQAKT